MKKLILTAFEPFGGMELNSSMLVLDKIPDELGNVKIYKRILPVEYDISFLILEQYIEQLEPDYVICMGQAGGRNSICLEKLAVNINNSKSPDNKGKILEHKPIDDEGKEGYFSNLPLLEIYEELCGTDVEITYSAGTFVCNNIFYNLMSHISKTKKEIEGGFIHLPYTEHFEKDKFITLDRQAEIIEKIICYLGRAI